MKNSAIIFVFFGLIFVGAILFAFIYLPKMNQVNGLGGVELSMQLPASVADLRYFNKGISPFCLEKNNGLDIEVKEKTPVVAPVSGVVTNIYSGVNRVSIEVVRGIFVYISPVVNLHVSLDTYVNKGDILGYSEGQNIHLTLDNQKESRYECPYFFFNNEAKTAIDNGLTVSSNSTGRVCECNNLKY